MQATHIVTLGAESIPVDASTLNETVESLIKKNGGKFAGIDVKPIAKVEVVTDSPAVARALAPVATPVRGQTVDQAGAMRSLLDASLAEHAGFAPKKPLYTRGTMVVEMGVENARSSRLEHDRKPLVEDACAALIRQVAAEGRADHNIEAKTLRMNSNGVLVQKTEQGDYRFGPMSGDAFGSFLARTGIEGYRYLARCPAKLRAINVNNWLAGIDGLPVPGNTLKLRQRNHPCGGREVFGVVSSGYTPYDADEVALDVAEAFRGMEARGTVDYDGSRTRIEAIYHSNVQPENYVAGEFFKAGVIIRTDDTGGGSLKVSACVWQNLCLNLIIIDEAEQEIASLRHIGSKGRMTERFQQALADAADKVEAFRLQWGGACREELGLVAGAMTLPLEQVIEGYCNGVIERELVPVRGRRPEVLKQLVAMHAKDVSSATSVAPVTRASIVNAFTRWAHEFNRDPFFADDVSRAAGRLIASPKPLPFLPLEKTKG